MTLEHSAIPAFVLQTKEEGDQGIVRHLISVYGVEDTGKDIAHKGMFDLSVQQKGKGFKVLDAHKHASALDVVGMCLGLKEISRDQLPAEVIDRYPEATGGMLAQTKYLLDTPEGAGIFARIKAGAVDQFSIGYNPIDVDYERKEDGTRLRHLKAVDLVEYSAVPFAMNSAAVTLDAKSEAPEETKNPWDVFEVDGEYCVYKVDSDGNKTGKALGCHGTKKEAKKQIAALHANVDEKATGYLMLASQVREAFDKKFGWYSDLEKTYRVYDIFEDYVVVRASGDPFFYRVDFEVAGGEYKFAEQDSWVAGMIEFVPAPVEEDMEDTEEKQDLSLELLLELELEQLGVVEVLSEEVGKA